MVSQNKQTSVKTVVVICNAKLVKFKNTTRLCLTGFTLEILKL